MSDENKPNPLEDVTKGLGLLFRAAKTAVERLPTERLENIVQEGAKEVGKAIETVTDVIDREVLGNKPPAAPPANASHAAPGSQPPPANVDASSPHPHSGEPPHASSTTSSSDAEAPKGPRIG